MSIIDRDAVLKKFFMKLRQIGRMQVGRLLGSVASSSGAYKALIDVLEHCYFMRAEINAQTALLMAKGVFTQSEFQKALEDELRIYFEACAKDWPEIEFNEDGFVVTDPPALAERMRREGWPP
jgi:hypothetical protein